MKLENLSADEFMVALATIAESVAVIKDSKSGKTFMSDLGDYRGSLADVPEDERNGKAVDFLVTSLLKNLPAFCRENGDAVYSILGACDGQTLKEYKKAFTPKKLIDDVKALGTFVGENLEDVQGFLASE